MAVRGINGVPSLERAFKIGVNDSLRFELADGLVELAQITSDKEALEWAKARRREILLSLHSADSRVVKYLIEYVRVDGCALFIDRYDTSSLNNIFNESKPQYSSTIKATEAFFRFLEGSSGPVVLRKSHNPP